MNFTRDITLEQWKWLLARYAEGYTMRQLGDWLGIHPRTISRHWDALGIRTLLPEELPPLRERLQEFEVLGWE